MCLAMTVVETLCKTGEGLRDLAVSHEPFQWCCTCAAAGTLHLDLDDGLLQLGLKGDGVSRLRGGWDGHMLVCLLGAVRIERSA